MKNEKSNLFFVSLLTVILIYGFIIILVMSDKIQWLDVPIIQLVQSFESPHLTAFMKLISFIGSSKVIIPLTIVLMVIFYFVLKHRYELIFFAVTLLGSTILNTVLKSVFHRQRPTEHRLADALGYSFPSGHSMAAFTLYVIIAFLIWKHAKGYMGKTIIVLITITMILLIGLSRIYLGVHYPSDVIGGYLTSALWVALSIRLFEKFNRRFL